MNKVEFEPIYKGRLNYRRKKSTEVLTSKVSRARVMVRVNLRLVLRLGLGLGLGLGLFDVDYSTHFDINPFDLKCRRSDCRH